VPYLGGLYLVKAISLEDDAGRVDKEGDIGRHVEGNSIPESCMIGMKYAIRTCSSSLLVSVGRLPVTRDKRTTPKA
jgi:hypothetical protein